MQSFRNKRSYTCFYYLLVLLFGVSNIHAQAPANDDKANATVLTLSSQGGFDSGGNIYTVVNATVDEPLPPNWSYGLDGNVWFKFVATQSVMNIKVTGGMINKMAALYNNQGAIVESKTGPYKGNLGILVENAVVNQEYHLNIDGRIASTFGISISGAVDYDYKDYAQVIQLNNQGEFESTRSAYSLDGTTPDESEPPNWSYGLEGNVWFEFEAKQPLFNLVITGSGKNKQAALYKKTGMTLLESKTGPYEGNLGMLDTLIVGETYLLNVDGRVANSSFGLKINSTVDFDYKEAAEILVLNAQGELETATNAYSMVDKTPDQDIPPNWSYERNQNVWFKFEATKPLFNLVITGGGKHKLAALYKEDMTLVKSMTGPYNGYLGLWETLVVGDEYYLNIDGRVVGASFGLSINSTLDFDYKSHAMDVTLDAYGKYESGANEFTLAGSTADESAPPNWSYGLNHNVWFKFQPVVSSVRITLTGSLNNKMIAVYDQDNNLIHSDNGPYIGNHEVVLTGLDVTKQYYLNVDGRTFNSFGLKIDSNNDARSDALPLTITNGSYCSSDTGFTTVWATTDNPTGVTIYNNVWFEWTEVTGWDHTIQLDLSGAGSLGNATMMVLDADNNVLAQANNTTGSNTLELALTGLVAGASYYLTVGSHSDNTAHRGSFDLCISTPMSCLTQLWAIASGSWDSPGTWSDTEGGQPVAAIPCATTDVFIKGFDISFNSTGIETAKRVEIIGTNANTLTRLNVQTGELNVKEEVVTSGAGAKLQNASDARIKVTGQ